ncbi:MAG: hypothetical protein H0U53_10265 [Actinobacteria bacterium]|nr:hypothetical protein [Actinomycetota bacterium]
MVVVGAVVVGADDVEAIVGAPPVVDSAAVVVAVWLPQLRIKENINDQCHDFITPSPFLLVVRLARSGPAGRS